MALHVPGATQNTKQDMWDIYLREFVVSGSQLDLKGKNLENISPKLWNDYSQLTTLDLSENP